MFQKREVPTKLDKEYLKKYRNNKSYIFSAQNQLEINNKIKEVLSKEKVLSGLVKDPNTVFRDNKADISLSVQQRNNPLTINSIQTEISTGNEDTNVIFNEINNNSFKSPLKDFCCDNNTIQQKINETNKETPPVKTRLIDFKNFTSVDPVKTNKMNDSAFNNKNVLKNNLYSKSKPWKSNFRNKSSGLSQKTTMSVNNMKVPLLLKYYSTLNLKRVTNNKIPKTLHLSPIKKTAYDYTPKYGNHPQETDLKKLENKTLNFIKKVECINKVFEVEGNERNTHKRDYYNKNNDTKKPYSRLVHNTEKKIPTNSFKYNKENNNAVKRTYKSVSPDKRIKKEPENFGSNRSSRLNSTGNFTKKVENRSYRTQLCKYIFNNSCTRGDDCTYSHDFSKFPCKAFFIRNNCKRKNCSFSHDKNIDKVLIEKLREDDNDNSSDNRVVYISTLLNLEDKKN